MPSSTIFQVRSLNSGIKLFVVLLLLTARCLANRNVIGVESDYRHGYCMYTSTDINCWNSFETSTMQDRSPYIGIYSKHVDELPEQTGFRHDCVYQSLSNEQRSPNGDAKIELLCTDGSQAVRIDDHYGECLVELTEQEKKQFYQQRRHDGLQRYRQFITSSGHGRQGPPGPSYTPLRRSQSFSSHCCIFPGIWLWAHGGSSNSGTISLSLPKGSTVCRSVAIASANVVRLMSVASQDQRYMGNLIKRGHSLPADQIWLQGFNEGQLGASVSGHRAESLQVPGKAHETFLGCATYASSSIKADIVIQPVLS